LGAVIDGLRGMRRLRDRLSVEVGRSDALIDPQAKAAKAAQDESELALKAQGALKPDATQSEKDDAKTKADKATETLNKAKAALDEAKVNRTKAAGTVVSFFNQFMSTAIGTRLDAIKAAETAYGFIGEAATAVDFHPEVIH
jgi:hypothetical protein